MIPIPNLIEIQKKSYERFLQMKLLSTEREDLGLQAVFKSIFPITDFRGNCELQFVEYAIGVWECKCGKLEGLGHVREGTICDTCGDQVKLKLKYDVEECQQRGMTYSVPLKVTIRLTVYDKDPESGVRSIRDIKEQEVYFGDIPLMTDNGTFIINGTERVIVSQLHRSPGVFFHEVDKNSYLAQIIPYRGSWVEFECDQKNLLYVRIDRKRKFLATVFMRALGLRTNEDILRNFYAVENVTLRDGQYYVGLSSTQQGRRFSRDIVAKGGKEPILAAGRRMTRVTLEKAEKAGVTEIQLEAEDLEGAHSIADVVNAETGEVLVECNEEVTVEKLGEFLENDIANFEAFYPEREDIGSIISVTARKDTVKITEEALIEIYRRLRPGDPPTLESSRSLFQSMFFNPQKYDFSRVGRLKLNTKLSLEGDLGQRLLEPKDFFAVVRYLLRLAANVGSVDDIDHLGNRRVRSVGELLENQFRIGLVRMERAIKEKMSVYQEMATAMPHDLINAKPVMAAVREFFGSSQLSQFMDQTNPLSEVTHKRRLSALGPGGLSRERAGFEVRDVHPTHYGRICPIETPEGPNIGLISSLSCYARINDYGFIESPYRKVQDGQVVDHVIVTSAGDTELEAGQVVERGEFERQNRKLGKAGGKPAHAENHAFYLSAWEEDQYVIAQANAKVDDKGNLVNDRANCRQAGNFALTPRDQVDYIDVSPKQLVSVAASLIPFLENDDANRALMGSNMQRQAVPLLRAEAPIVGTGMEHTTARDSGAVVVCQRAGIVDSVDSRRVIVRIEDGSSGKRQKEIGADIYSLTKFKRSNQNTCMNQRPIVRVGDRVERGQVIGDGPCTDKGELALGRNILVAFMPWRGYNFEDAILVSEKLVKVDAYTSIHIEEFDTESRDTKLGPEEITRDIPNVSESFLANLDESGIIRIGAYVKPSDILVGKVTPKGETQLTPEEKLLRAIFGEKAGDVRDASLACPPGIEGIVVDVKIFSRKGVDKDERAKAIESEDLAMLEKNLNDEVRILKEERNKRVIERLSGSRLEEDLVNPRTGEKILQKGVKLTMDMLRELRPAYLGLLETDVTVEVLDEIQEVEDKTERQIEVLKALFEERMTRLQKGDELPPGVIKMVKVYVAMKRKLSVGDKMAGRHGNKGVIAKIVPEEDMPYLPDGSPVEIILNPLGVPSRMNVGQILETHLGWAGKVLGMHFSTPVFDGASEGQIKELLEKANEKLQSDGDFRPNVLKSGKTILSDGRTGESFEQPVTVGYIYMLKLSHLVDDKMHARSIGPYSLITQQPLGGKAQFGGQRFGEMEVWALEAYGAAHTLQELLTAKSDDVYGRAKIYEAIVKGDTSFTPGLPESFNVLIRELQSLCLDVELLKTKD